MHLEPLTDVQTIASGEVFPLIDCSVAKVFLDNKHCSRVVTAQVVKPQRDRSKLVQKIGRNPEINLNNVRHKKQTFFTVGVYH